MESVSPLPLAPSIALAIETMDIRTAMFERASAYRGTPRERLTAIGVAAELFVRLYPHHFQVEQLIRSRSIWEKTTEKRRLQMATCETRCVGVTAGIVRDAMAQEHLTLPAGVTPECLVFGLWSQTFGAYSIVATGQSLHHLGIPDPFFAVRMATLMAMDGYGWEPLSTHYDYVALFERLLLELFPDECGQTNLFREAR